MNNTDEIVGYFVPGKLPNSCRSCKFSSLHYSHPAWAKNYVPIKSYVDNKENGPNSCGYCCELELSLEGKRTHVVRMTHEQEEPRPEWCPLQEIRIRNKPCSMSFEITGGKDA